MELKRAMEQVKSGAVKSVTFKGIGKLTYPIEFTWNDGIDLGIADMVPTERLRYYYRGYQYDFDKEHRCTDVRKGNEWGKPVQGCTHSKAMMKVRDLIKQES